MLKEDFAHRFKLACESSSRAPKSQKALGKFLGVSGTMIFNWRNGLKLPSTETGIKISEKLGVNFNWLMTGNGSMTGKELINGISDNIGNYDAINRSALKKAFIFLETHLTPEARAEKGPEWLADIFYRLYKAYTLHDMENTDPQMIMDLLAND